MIRACRSLALCLLAAVSATGCGQLRAPFCDLTPPPAMAFTTLAAQKTARPAQTAQPAMGESTTPNQLPISLDTVLRLAQDQNGRINIARLRLQEAFAEEDLAAKRWLPQITVGPAYYRHEGGIQDFNG